MLNFLICRCRLNKIRPFHLIDDFSDQFMTKIDLKRFNDESVLHSSFSQDHKKGFMIGRTMNPNMMLNTSNMQHTVRNISRLPFCKFRHYSKLEDDQRLWGYSKLVKSYEAEIFEEEDCHSYDCSKHSKIFKFPEKGFCLFGPWIKSTSR